MLLQVLHRSARDGLLHRPREYRDAVIFLRRKHQKMNMLRHEHIGEHLILMLGRGFVDGVSKPLASTGACQERMSSVAAESQGMSVTGDIECFSVAT